MHHEETETASSPSLSRPIYNETADTYSVWVRGIASGAGGDSLHVGLDSAAPRSVANLTGFTNEWGWSRVTPAGNATLDLTTTDTHTLQVDAAGQLLLLAHEGVTDTLASYAYAYDALGNRVLVTETLREDMLQFQRGWPPLALTR